ncbi:MAG: BrnT family toxin [Thermomicrobiales bacterium]
MAYSVCEWDPEKDAENQRKHGVDFEDACCVFDDLYHIVVPDDCDYVEDRLIATGRVGSKVLVVVFTERNGRERIISARKANRREEETYFERFA